MRASAWISLAVGVVMITAPVDAATRTRPFKAHSWQVQFSDGLPVAIALRCPDCPADLELRCLARGRGLLELTLGGAAVANGRAGASKQITLALGHHSERRRAITHNRERGYTPVLQLANDDALFDRLQHGDVLRIRFYGQRSVVGLQGARGPIQEVRKACQETASPVPNKHCTWSVVIACHGRRSAAEAVARSVPNAFVRARPGNYCAVLASADLAVAQGRAKRYGGYVRRSCLP